RVVVQREPRRRRALVEDLAGVELVRLRLEALVLDEALELRRIRVRDRRARNAGVRLRRRVRGAVVGEHHLTVRALFAEGGAPRILQLLLAQNLGRARAARLMALLAIEDRVLDVGLLEQRVAGVPALHLRRQQIIRSAAARLGVARLLEAEEEEVE